MRDDNVPITQEKTPQENIAPSVTTSTPVIVEPRRSGRVSKEPERWIGQGESSESVSGHPEL